MFCKFSILDISSNGMSSMSFFKDPQSIKWLLDADFENIILDDSIIGGFSDESIIFLGDKQNVTFSAENLLQSSLSVTPEGTFINTQQFKFVDPFSKKSILHLGGEHISMVGEFSGKTLTTDAFKTPRVVSDHLHDLEISSPDGKLNMIGNEGLYTDSKTMDIQTENDINVDIQDKTYSIELNGFDGGVTLNKSRLRDTTASSLIVTDGKRYRLCLCLNTGEIYRAEITSTSITCAIAKVNPC